MGLWETWLVVAAAVHLGFQATVTLLVYPVLLERGRKGDGWASVHSAHTRRITPLVVLVYGALVPPVVVTAWRVLAGEAGWGATLAVAAALAAFVATAAVAAPAHGVLGRGWREPVARRLVRADRARLGAALLCLAGAGAALAA